MVDPELLRCFGFYSSLLLGKMMLLQHLTARERGKKGAYANAEDAAFKGLEGAHKDDDVERIRRAHRNDMENIYLFLVNALIFLLTGPEVGFAVNLVRFVSEKYTVVWNSIIQNFFAAFLISRIFAAARFIHTFVYLYKVSSSK